MPGEVPGAAADAADAPAEESGDGGAANGAPKVCSVIVSSGDWGEVTARMTKEHGTTFASLNMANAYGPGGGYHMGMVAQEENMFRWVGVGSG